MAIERDSSYECSVLCSPLQCHSTPEMVEVGVTRNGYPPVISNDHNEGQMLVATVLIM